jgi:hypothetical protein
VRISRSILYPQPKSAGLCSWSSSGTQRRRGVPDPYGTSKRLRVPKTPGENRPAGPAGSEGSIGMQWDPLRMGPKRRDPLRYGRSTQQRSVPSHSLRSCSGPAAAKPVSVKSVPATLPECAADMRPARRGRPIGTTVFCCSNGALVSVAPAGPLAPNGPDGCQGDLRRVGNCPGTSFPLMAVYRRFTRRRVRFSANHRSARRGRCVWKSAAGLTCISWGGIQAPIIFTTFGASVNPQKDSVVS